MTPKLTLQDEVYNGAANTKSPSEHWSGLNLSAIKCSDALNVIFGEFATTVLCSLVDSTSCPSFRNTISYVIRSSSKEEMIRPDARWVVASMEHAQTFGVPVMNYPTGNVGSDVLAELPVPVHVAVTATECSGPYPAASSFCHYKNSLPKSVLKVFRKVLSDSKFLCNLFLHKSVFLICATSPARQGAGALFMMDSIWSNLKVKPCRNT